MRIFTDEGKAAGSSIVALSYKFNAQPSKAEHLVAVQVTVTRASDGQGVCVPVLVSLTGFGSTGIELKHDHTVIGTVGWQGSIPVFDPMTLQVVLYGVSATDLYKVAYVVTENGEDRGVGTASQNMVSVVPLGLPKLVAVTSAAAASDLNFRPPQYKAWRVMGVHGLHDDGGGSHTLNWQLYDGTTTDNRMSKSCASGVHINFNYGVDFAICYEPEILTYDTYANLHSADAMASGKKLYIVGLVVEYGWSTQ